ncbi:hypothetical protein NP233_g930 [Leucocoprinus birnbaumii]|uniref:Uncharacterized protein n=1 Tax=Leucocoprinus birnbaumii TaxID=56174 RepID=A0AAD5W691_9AGAR|nr:hypothetical protein NP233_g930 [Leucocoprinus birnbaumii]
MPRPLIAFETLLARRVLTSPSPRPLDWHDRHAPIVARYATPTPDPSKTKASKKGGGEKGKSRAAGK